MVTSPRTLCGVECRLDSQGRNMLQEVTVLLQRLCHARTPERRHTSPIACSKGWVGLQGCRRGIRAWLWRTSRLVSLLANSVAQGLSVTGCESELWSPLHLKVGRMRGEARTRQRRAEVGRASRTRSNARVAGCAGSRWLGERELPWCGRPRWADKGGAGLQTRMIGAPRGVETIEGCDARRCGKCGELACKAGGPQPGGASGSATCVPREACMWDTEESTQVVGPTSLYRRIPARRDWPDTRRSRLGFGRRSGSDFRRGADVRGPEAFLRRRQCSVCSQFRPPGPDARAWVCAPAAPPSPASAWALSAANAAAGGSRVRRRKRKRWPPGAAPLPPRCAGGGAHDRADVFPTGSPPTRVGTGMPWEDGKTLTHRLLAGIAHQATYSAQLAAPHWGWDRHRWPLSQRTHKKGPSAH